LRADEGAREDFLEENKKHGTMAMRDGLNHVFKQLDVPLQVGSQGGPATFEDMSESGLRSRLETLKVEMKLIEKYLADGLTPLPTVRRAPKKADGVKPVDDAKPGHDVEAEEGEAYVEVDSLTRRLKKWHTVDARTDIPYQMMSTFELYPQWMPWCQSGTVLSTHPSKGVTRATVGFGIKVPFLGTIGDVVEYRVELDPPAASHGAARVYTISEQSRYMQKLVYDWRFIPLDDVRTKVVLEVEFKGAAQWCMPIWEGLRNDVINGVWKAFADRVVTLQAAAGGDANRPLARPKLAAVTAVLQGPFLRDEAVVVTESNGRTIRHANNAFAKLAGRPVESLPGKDIPDLLQNFKTDPNILKGLGSAIRNRFSATAIVRNQNMAGEEFLNRLTLAPLDDDEHDRGVIFWAVLKVVHGMDQRLEFSAPDALDAAWGPDYQHPAALNGLTRSPDSISEVK
jgi:ribosome-associated toxin RatA of RatAB toxin-antitoxin module